MLLCVASILANPAIAETSQTPKITCNQVIKACDKALKDKDDTIKLSDLAIQKLTDVNKQLDKKVSEDDAKLSSIWRNPFVLIGIGALAGVLLTRVSR